MVMMLQRRQNLQEKHATAGRNGVAVVSVLEKSIRKGKQPRITKRKLKPKRLHHKFTPLKISRKELKVRNGHFEKPPLRLICRLKYLD